MKATELEVDTLEFFSQAYASKGFPKPSAIEVLERMNTGSGRRVVLKTASVIDGYSGYLDMQGHFIEMDGLEFGLMATISVEKGVIDELEFSVYGGQIWNGEETCWRIV